MAREVVATLDDGARRLRAAAIGFSAQAARIRRARAGRARGRRRKRSRTQRTATSRWCSAPRCRGSRTTSSRAAASSRRFPRTPTTRRSISQPPCRWSRTSCALAATRRRRLARAALRARDASTRSRRCTRTARATLAAMRFLDPQHAEAPAAAAAPALRARRAREGGSQHPARHPCADRSIAGEALTMDPTIHRCLNCGVRAPDAYCPACGQRHARAVADVPRSSCARRWAGTSPTTASSGRRSRRSCSGRDSSRANISRAVAGATSARRGSSSYRASSCSRRCGSPPIRSTSASAQFDPSKEASGDRVPKERVEDRKGWSRSAKRTAGPGELVTLDDDFNLNMSEFAGTMGILAQADCALQRASARAEGGADRRGNAPLRPVCDVRAAARVRRLAEARLSRPAPPPSIATAALWRASRVRRAQPRIPVRRGLADGHRAERMDDGRCS